MTRVEDYLAKILSRTISEEDKWRMGAAQFLTISNSYTNKDQEQLGVVAKDLIVANYARIVVAQKYPDLFHTNVARSRKIENEVYRNVFDLISG